MKPFRILFLTCTLLTFVASSEAALSIEAEYKGEYYQVIDAKRALPVIEVKGKKRSVSRSQFRVNREGDPPLEDTFYMIRNRTTTTRNQTLQGGPKSQLFVFRAEIKSNVDMKNNFIMVSMKNTYGQQRLIIYEVRDLKAEKWTKVSFSVPTDNSQNKGGIQQILFSNGTQVLDQKQYNQANRKRRR